MAWRRGAARPGDVIAVAKVDEAKSGLILGKKGSASAELPISYPARNAALAPTEASVLRG